MMKPALMALAATTLLFPAQAALAEDKQDEKPKPAPFTSKIGVHLIGKYTPGTQKMVRARMPVLKILDLHDDMIQAARDYKKYNPDGIVVLRCFEPVRYTIDQDPVERAEYHWNEIYWKRMKALPEADRKLIDYVESTNEMGECPTWEDDDSTRWFTRFQIRFTELAAKEGYRHVLANIPVGNPGGPDDGRHRIRIFAPALRHAMQHGGAWSYHAYTIQYTTDPEIEQWYSLRYRKFYEAFTGEWADLKKMPMIITEAGVDDHGNADKDGWLARGSAEKFQNWLRWFDSELKKDDYVIGATLFQNGAGAAWGGWASFELETIADWLVNYWNVETAKPKPAARLKY